MDTFHRSVVAFRRSSPATREDSSEDYDDFSYFVNESDPKTEYQHYSSWRRNVSFINPFQSSLPRSKSVAAKYGPQLGDVSPEQQHSPLQGKARIMRRGLMPITAEKMKIPPRVSSKPQITSSTRSSLSFGGDLTFDIKLEDSNDELRNWRRFPSQMPTTAFLAEDRQLPARSIGLGHSGMYDWDGGKAPEAAVSQDSLALAEVSPLRFDGHRGSVPRSSLSAKHPEGDVSEVISQPIGVAEGGHPQRAVEEQDPFTNSSARQFASKKTEEQLPKREPKTINTEVIPAAVTKTQVGTKEGLASNENGERTNDTRSPYAEVLGTQSSKSELSEILDLYMDRSHTSALTTAPVSAGRRPNSRDKDSSLQELKAPQQILRHRIENDDKVGNGSHENLLARELGPQPSIGGIVQSANPSQGAGVYEMIQPTAPPAARRHASSGDNRSTTRKVRKWISNRLSLAGLLDKNSVNASPQRHASSAGGWNDYTDQRNSPPRADGNISPDTNLDSYTSSEASKSRQRSLESSIQEFQRVLQETLSRRSAMGNNRTGQSQYLPLPGITVTESETLTKADNRGAKVDKPVTRQSSGVSSARNEYHKTLTWVSDPNVAPTGSSKRNIPESPRTDDTIILDQTSKSEDLPATSPTVESTIQIDPQIPGAYPDLVNSAPPDHFFGDLTNTSGHRSFPLSPDRGQTTQAHVPVERRKTFPEPLFIPHHEVEEPQNDSFNAVGSQSAEFLRTQLPAFQKMREFVRRNQHPDVQPRVSSAAFRAPLSAGHDRADGDFDTVQLRPEAEEKLELQEFQKGHRRHHSFRGKMRAGLHRAHRKNILARDWKPAKKRFTAIVACLSTALIGLIVGIYAGQVPAIQYAIVDEDTHYAVLGNVFFYTGMALTTFVAWPLPLLYGRKRFVLAAFAILLPLQFPQALVVSQQRSPQTSLYRVGLLLPRSISGIVIGFANLNLWPTLLDLYGSSLQSSNPHQESVDQNDPRRHGGGMGIWLSVWTWCHIGSIGVGFLIGAAIIGFLNVAWGFWIVIFLTLVVLLLNVLAPETRRSAFRRSMAEVRNGADVSRRVGRGEVMMHLYSTGPLHWWEEVRAGLSLNLRMLKQSGFAIMLLYQGWIYGQVVMIMILLGALASRYYQYLPQYVALCVAAFPLGAVLAIPFQKASLFSRSRYNAQRTDSMTFQKRVSWSSHLVRRAVFMIILPLAAIAYTLSSEGPPVPIGVPVFFAAVIGFVTNLALSECYGIIMETFDVSDLQPGMTGRPRKELPAEALRHRTNFSCFPRVTAGFALVQTASFGIAAVATAVGGNVERAHGVEMATGIVAAVLLGLTLLLIAALTRFRTVQVVPTTRVGTAELSGPGEDLPVIIGHPSGTTRRISLLELGKMTRWTEIRRRNKLLGTGPHGRFI